MVSLGAFESCCETERFFSPIICLKIHPCIYLKDYSDCFEGLSYSILGFLIHSLELPIDFVNTEIFLISKKPLARSSRDFSTSIQILSIPCHFACWYDSVTVSGNGNMELDSISSSSNINTEVFIIIKKYSLPKKIGYGKVATMINLIVLGIIAEIQWLKP